MKEKLNLFKMLNLPFANQDFTNQFFRTLGYIYEECADIGECFTIASKIKDDDFHSWYDEWNSTAQRIQGMAEKSYHMGCTVSAKEAYLRACEYYRQSAFFLRDNLEDPRLISAYHQSAECFRKAALLFEHPVSAVSIPFSGTTLPGYFFLADNEHTPKATIIILGGYDSTLEELYPLGSKAALKRGYNCLTFVGPGQGAALVNQHLYMRPDFENVLSPVLDWLLEQPQVNKGKIGLIGRSFGGYLAPRGVCGEARVAAVVCDPGQLDLSAPLAQRLSPEVYAMWKEGDKEGVNDSFSKVFEKNKQLKFFFHSRMQVHGINNVFDYFNEIKKYNFTDMINSITCSVCVCDNPTDRIASRGNTLFEALKGDKYYYGFDADIGAGLHCEAGAAAYFEQQIFDWLDSKLKSQKGKITIVIPYKFYTYNSNTTGEKYEY